MGLASSSPEDGKRVLSVYVATWNLGAARFSPFLAPGSVVLTRLSLLLAWIRLPRTQQTSRRRTCPRSSLAKGRPTTLSPSACRVRACVCVF